MQTHTADLTTTDTRRPSPGLWFAAIAEIAVAFVVATMLLGSGTASPPMGHSGMAAMRTTPAQIHWQATTLAAAGLIAAMLIWWLATRARIPAIVAAVGLFVVGASEEARVLAVQSHLVAMTMLEALLVAGPLLLITALEPRQSNAPVSRSPLWAGTVIVAVILNSALLIALHLPGVHERGMSLAMVPVWIAPLTLTIGLGYWAAILLTSGCVAPTVRRGSLIIGQEVAAILGLATLIRPSPYPHHASPLGLSPVLDQRLGGLLMVVTCAAVTLTLAKRLAPQQPRTEHHVH